ncbi:hypothetical protein CCUS01_16490 [Colletotrichum cuscutae]|uniref:Uncharacterized protein n=1 Tax=Colletotrichum cuscutae TaxID=1209917 RepID=A0AAI9V9P5_9PEZI|nr:hypothetical protein CCUS01_16490 [Colletotrichum cuscutae]
MSQYPPPGQQPYYGSPPPPQGGYPPQGYPPPGQQPVSSLAPLTPKPPTRSPDAWESMGTVTLCCEKPDTNLHCSRRCTTLPRARLPLPRRRRRMTRAASTAGEFDIDSLGALAAREMEQNRADHAQIASPLSAAAGSAERPASAASSA